MLQVFLDFDGTIVDSKLAHYKAYDDALSELGLSMEDVGDNWFGATTKTIIESVVSKKKDDLVDNRLIESTCLRKSKLARINTLNLPPNNNIINILNSQCQNLVFTIFSNSSKISINNYIEKYLGFVKWEGICSGQELGLSKFVPDELEVMVDKFKIIDNFLFIDDSLQFIELCNRYNYSSIHYKKNKNLKHEIYTYNSTLCR